MSMKLYHHKTDGGAEYLSDTFMDWEHNGKSGREGVVNDKTKYVVRIDGDITQDAELTICDAAAPDLLEACKMMLRLIEGEELEERFDGETTVLRAAIAAATR